MTDNRTNGPTGPAAQPLRLAGAGPAEALVPGQSSPVAVSVLQVKDDASGGARCGADREAIPFEVRAAMVSAGTQPGIRTHLVGGRIPGAVIYRLR